MNITVQSDFGDTRRPDAGRLLVIGITLPETSGCRADEVASIVTLLDSGAIDRMHLRKDDVDEVLRLLAAVPARLHRRLSLHRVAAPHGCMAWEHGPQSSARSCSCHTLDEVERELVRRQYLFLSPVFDSISKSGYRAVAFDLERLQRLRGGALVVALGGVTPGHFGQLRGMGFDGAAMLGYLHDTDTDNIINEIRCYNS